MKWGRCPDGCPPSRTRGVGEHDWACRGDRRRRSDRLDVGGRVDPGGSRRRRHRAARQPGPRRLALRRSAFAHYRGARSARCRGPVPGGGARHAGPGFRRHPAGHQRFSYPPQLRARTVAGRLRAHTGRLGRRVGGADHARARGDGIHAGRDRRRRRAVGWPVAPGGVPRRVRRRTQRDPKDGRHRILRVGIRRPAG